MSGRPVQASDDQTDKALSGPFLAPREPDTAGIWRGRTGRASLRFRTLGGRAAEAQTGRLQAAGRRQFRDGVHCHRHCRREQDAADGSWLPVTSYRLGFLRTPSFLAAGPASI